MKSELDVGGTLREVFETYRDQAGVLLPVAFWLFLLSAIVGGLSGENLALAPVELLVTTIVTTLYTGMVVALVSDLQDGRRDFSAGELIRSALPVLLPLIAASVLFLIGMILGFLLLIVPGLFLITIWAVFAPVIVVERTGIFAAFRRSRDLVRGNGWQVLGAVIVAFAIAVAAALALSAIGASIDDGPIMRIVFGAIAATFTAPVQGLVAAVLYFRLLAIERSAAPEVPPEPSVLEQTGDG